MKTKYYAVWGVMVWECMTVMIRLKGTGNF